MKQLQAPSGLHFRGLYKRLMEAVSDITRTSPTVEVVSRLLRVLVDDPVIPLIGGRVWTREHDQYRLIDCVGGRKAIVPNHRICLKEPVIQMIRTQGACYITESTPGYNSKLEDELGVHEYGAMAFGDEDQFLVSLDVLTEHFDAPEDVRTFLFVLRYIANQKIDKDRVVGILREACDVQTSVIPLDAPDYSGYDIFGKSTLPHREKVGGDVFDFITSPSGDLVVLVADSCGHGLSSAVMARDVRTAVHMGVLDEIAPSLLVTRVNRVLCARSPSDRFISLFFARIDTSHGLTVVSAGHPGFLLRGETTRALRTGGLVLGVHPNASYQFEYQTLEPGDVVCIYTDGLSEARGLDSLHFGEERILECLRRFRDLPAEQIIEKTFALVATFTEGSQEDDQTMVVVKRL